MEEQGLSRRRRRGEAEEPEEVARFQETHRRLSDRVERALMKLVILGLVGLVLVQALATSPDLRRKLNLLEGTDGYVLTEDSSWWQRLTGSEAGTQTETPQAAVAAPAARAFALTVQLETMRSAPKAKLLVGGKALADFSTGQATVSVEPGQLIAVDGGAYAQRLTFRVVAAPGLESPTLGSEVVTSGDRQTLGVVRKRSY